ncbi:LysR family transcriptional regulator [Sansalvadorimonas sp. 2012CJ34-2]|uniref:LysR family transcriptional regulator n=1 Tax=Parendozoicomonas callyspongiae TaxID=2942213 RepID=A0ABT0PIV1_9GAMM|nr:LysR family transcriptional regulator [Sansalvadorimonas sp. 2012CJ34-2]MCL6271324.1 LysR family transcriptional regulator [Sansalvadorimonas sp. 2012CJ34-2]
MSNINWKGVDLNLLLTFDALMVQRSVSRAAEQMHLGQSAMSYNLNRLRKLLKDPLFERQGHIMVPTRRAEDLAPRIQAVLTAIRDDILQPASFVPGEYCGRIQIGLNDYTELVFGPVLFDALMQQAPGCQIVFRAADDSNYQQLFEQGEIDLAIGTYPELPEGLVRQQLYREKHVCLFDNSMLQVDQPISLEDYLATPQAMVSPTGELASPVDKRLSNLGYERHMVLGSSRFITLRHLLIGRRLLCVMAEMMGRTEFFAHKLTICPPPVEVPDFDIEMILKKRDCNHPRMQWLSNQVQQVIKQHIASIFAKSGKSSEQNVSQAGLPQPG